MVVFSQFKESINRYWTIMVHKLLAWTINHSEQVDKPVPKNSLYYVHEIEEIIKISMNKLKYINKIYFSIFIEKLTFNYFKLVN